MTYNLWIFSKYNPNCNTVFVWTTIGYGMWWTHNYYHLQLKWYATRPRVKNKYAIFYGLITNGWHNTVKFWTSITINMHRAIIIGGWVVVVCWNRFRISQFHVIFVICHGFLSIYFQIRTHLRVASCERPKSIHFCSISVFFFFSRTYQISCTHFSIICCVTFTAAIKPNAPTPTTYTLTNHHSFGCCLFIFAF